MSIGPYEKLHGVDPLFILQFDKQGNAKSTQTTELILQELQSNTYTDIYLFSHGWNNDFGDALSLYRKFFTLYLELRAKYALGAGVYRPVFIGLHWPSIILTLPWETGPRIAAADSADTLTDAFARVKDVIAECITPEQTARFYELTERDSLNEEQARELADILLPLYRSGTLDAEGGAAADVHIDGIIAAWKSVPGQSQQKPPAYGDHGRVKDSLTSEPRAAAWTDFLDPRNAVRVTTVLIMKDRAGLVGRKGLAPLLAQLMRAVPVHLIGHSYGARVCLTALSSPALPAGQVASLLLLQPAVNQYCFAASVPGLTVPGGFVPALSRVKKKPIYSTFSGKDIPLHALFHLAARRVEDRGEIRYAADGPSEFSALGGYGPAGMATGESGEEIIHNAGTRYSPPAGVKVWGLDGSAGQIPGHGDVVSDYTCWALLDQEMN